MTRSESPQPTWPKSDAPLALEARELSVKYGAVHALCGVDLALAFGEVRALIGTNGSGKSTLFKCLMGHITPDEGSVTINSKAPGDIAYVPQHEQVDWNFPLSVSDVVASGRFAANHGRWWGRLAAKDRSIISEALDRTGLSDYKHRQIGQLSGGQKKRVFIARSIAQQSHIMLLDEPFAGVDYANEKQIGDLLRQLATEGTAVLVSTHNIARLADLADTATLINRHVVASGSVAEVTRAENLARAFGGTPECS